LASSLSIPLLPPCSPGFKLSGSPGILSSLNVLVLPIVLRSGRTFSWSSFQVHRNRVSSWHVDGEIGESFLVLSGAFSSGAFASEGRPPVGCCGKALFFNPRLLHKAEQHEGDILSLVAFAHPQIDDYLSSDGPPWILSCPPVSALGLVISLLRCLPLVLKSVPKTQMPPTIFTLVVGTKGLDFPGRFGQTRTWFQP